MQVQILPGAQLSLNPIARKIESRYHQMDWNKFSFDYHLDVANFWPDLIAIEAYKEAALNLVLPPDWRAQLDRLNRIRAVYGTTALEGNPLSEAEVAQQIEVEPTLTLKPPAKSSKEQIQIRNAGQAQDWTRQRFAPNTPPLMIADILLMHQKITEHSDTQNNEPGKFRTHSVTVGSPEMGGVHRGAPVEHLSRLMGEYVNFLNAKRATSMHPVMRALLAHFFLITIHPFGDGNGRVSRLVEAAILFRDGYNVHGFYGLSNYFYRNERDYKTLLQKCRDEQPFEVTPFVQFGLKGFASELKGINNFIKTKLNRIVYRDMLVRAFNKRVGSRRKLLNLREYNLLNFLLVETEPTDPFSDAPSRRIKFDELRAAEYIKASYGDVTQRTFLRELVRLQQLGFMKFTGSEDLIVELNFEAIGKY